MSAPAATRRSAGDAPWLLALALLWGAVIWRWWPAWSASTEQSFGFLVPLLAAALAWERLRDCPAETKPGASVQRVGGVLLSVALVMLPAALIVLTANPLWPAAQWISVGLAIVSSFLILVRWRGVAVAWHFAFPVLFVATALSWPRIVTVRLVGALVALNANLAATAVSLLGHPAVVHGAVIELANGVVGVDEACSGLRSLQTVWMAGWFFGELFRLRVAGRLRLVGASMLVALGANWVRTTVLTWLAAVHGPEVSEQWHDRAGALELAATLVLVALLAWRASRRVQAPAAVTRSATWSGEAWLGAVLAMAAAVSLVAPEAWYRWHEYKQPGNRVQWELHGNVGDWREIAVPERTKEILNASIVRGLARGGAWGELALLARWDDDVARVAAADLHDPTICVPMAGEEFFALPGPVTLEVGGVPVDFSIGRFGEGSEMRHLFYVHWDAWLGRSVEIGSNSIGDVAAWRLARVSEGRRRGDASYLIFVTREATREDAEAWLREWAPRLLAPK